MSLTDEDLPVLYDVIQSGDESIIRQTRLRRVGIDELDETSTSPLHFELPAHLQFDMLDRDTEFDEQALEIDLSNNALSADYHTPSNSRSRSLIEDEDSMELLIDEIVDRHILSLRNDLRLLLKRARKLP
jgi:hypothetical protein